MITSVTGSVIGDEDDKLMEATFSCLTSLGQGRQGCKNVSAFLLRCCCSSCDVCWTGENDIQKACMSDGSVLEWIGKRLALRNSVGKLEPRLLLTMLTHAEQLIRASQTHRFSLHPPTLFVLSMSFVFSVCVLFAHSFFCLFSSLFFFFGHSSIPFVPSSHLFDFVSIVLLGSVRILAP